MALRVGVRRRRRCLEERKTYTRRGMGSPRGEGEIRAAPGGDGLFQKREVLKLHLKSC